MLLKAQNLSVIFNSDLCLPCIFGHILHLTSFFLQNISPTSLPSGSQIVMFYPSLLYTRKKISECLLWIFAMSRTTHYLCSTIHLFYYPRHSSQEVLHTKESSININWIFWGVFLLQWTCFNASSSLLKLLLLHLHFVAMSPWLCVLISWYLWYSVQLVHSCSLRIVLWLIGGPVLP